MYKVESRWGHNKSIHVEWNLGKRCNLDCSYCPPEIHDNFSPHTNIETLKNAVDKLEQNDKSKRISLTGGEPCVHPNIEELISHLNSRVDWVNITTNITRKTEWYIKQPVNHWVFSLHFEDSGWKERVEKIVNFSKNSNTLFQVNVMAHQNLMSRVKEAVNTFNENNVPYVIRRIRWTWAHDYFKDNDYTKEDLNWMLENSATAKANVIIDGQYYYHANDVIKEHLNQFKGWSCNAGIESLMINWDGEVYRATCRVGGSLGNIYYNTFEYPQEPIICSRNWCTCAADIPLTKRAST